MFLCFNLQAVHARRYSPFGAFRDVLPVDRNGVIELGRPQRLLYLRQIERDRAGLVARYSYAYGKDRCIVSSGRCAERGTGKSVNGASGRSSAGYEMNDIKKQKDRLAAGLRGEKAHGHCAVGLELFPRAQSSLVPKSSQAGKGIFTVRPTLFYSVVYGNAASSLRVFPPHGYFR